ncbi:MAG TPA: alpha/beta hydrolase [Clostridia bacterium]|jgi:pimeloyl-ACP methyl ester carboxylesterase|nr:alpha/beta hydrolase [Clostridia bacterium]
MRIHEFGKNNDKVIVLIHPAVVMWDYYEYVISLLKNDYRIIVPVLPGYDLTNPKKHFTSVEEIASELADILIEKEIETIDVLYGCSMGGSVVLKMLNDKKITVKNAICDGGITPYKLPWIATRFIAIRDFLMVSIGKVCGYKLLKKAFSTDEYSEEDIKYIHNVLRFMSYKTIWRTFESCNNYKMDKNIPEYEGHLEYWYGDKEEKDRAWDIKYVKEAFPNVKFVKLKNIGHGSMASLYPEDMAKRITALLNG